MDTASALRFGQTLAPLRKSGVIIVGSGSLTHNLYEFRRSGSEAADYAIEFTQWIRQAVSRERLAKLRGFIGHGEYDSKLPVMWAQRSDRLLDELGVAHLMRLYPIDHGISAAMQDDFREWLQGVTKTH